MKVHRQIVAASLLLPVSLVFAGCSEAQEDAQSPDTPETVSTATAAITNKGAVDPGPRSGAAGAGAPLTPQPIDPNSATAQAQAGVACFPGLQPGMKTLCEKAIIRFQEVDSVSGSTVSTGIPGFIAAGTVEAGVGVGPTFNGAGCHICHSQPGVLGAGVAPSSPQFPGQPNPQVALATLDGAKNTVPSFITATGPIREARFKSDGGVHDLYTIAGRSDASGCSAAQPAFATQLAAGNVVFRIPIATFGDGLVENIPEMELESNLAQAQAQTQFATGGTFNRSGNDGTITRFGWKAQNKSLTIFASEAYNVEQGVTNLGFPDEREGGASNLNGCMAFNATPEDNTAFLTNSTTLNATDASEINADVFNFALAMQLSAPPTPTVTGIPSSACDTAVFGTCGIAAEIGSLEFQSIGCANCHTPSFTTAKSTFDPALSSVTISPFSDFAIHNMGTGLADGITQGNAGPQQFRTAPLWGVGQRLFFLHDGRTSDLTAAIAAHASTGSEANTVINNFNNLSKDAQTSILVFLRSL